MQSVAEHRCCNHNFCNYNLANVRKFSICFCLRNKPQGKNFHHNLVDISLILPSYHHRYQMCQKSRGFECKNFFTVLLKKHEDMFYIFNCRCKRTRTTSISSWELSIIRSFKNFFSLVLKNVHSQIFALHRGKIVVEPITQIF